MPRYIQTNYTQDTFLRNIAHQLSSKDEHEPDGILLYIQTCKYIILCYADLEYTLSYASVCLCPPNFVPPWESYLCMFSRNAAMSLFGGVALGLCLVCWLIQSTRMSLRCNAQCVATAYTIVMLDFHANAIIMMLIFLRFGIHNNFFFIFIEYSVWICVYIKQHGIQNCVQRL